MSERYSVTSGLRRCAVTAVLALAAAAAAPAWAIHEGAVAVEIVDDRGRSFEEFPLGGHQSDTYRAYLKARRGATYRIRVSNQTAERVGVVIAVDGRNIISGQRSDLRPREAMYVLDPWQSSDLRGWRTNLHEVHEFYFTDWPDSYAQRAFGDQSAQGVIALAVFRDRDWQRRLAEEEALSDLRSNDRSAARAPGKAAAGAPAPPGTGFGDRQYDPARRVEFVAESRPLGRSFLKYEWPEMLCRRGIACDESDRPERRRRNRLWHEDGGFAPYPPLGRLQQGPAGEPRR